MAEIAELTEHLRAIIGSAVSQIGLVVWPDRDALEETDVRLYLEMTSADGSTLSAVVATESDGQTPSIEFVQLSDGLPFSELESRKSMWSRDDFWQSQKVFSPELFLVTPDSESDLSKVCFQSVSQVFLVCFGDDETTITGVVLEVENGQRVWSVPSAYGNAVMSDVPDDWWPSPVVLRSV